MTGDDNVLDDSNSFPADGFEALDKYAKQVATHIKNADAAFAERFASARSNIEREARIKSYYSDDRFQKLAKSLIDAAPPAASSYYRQWLASLCYRDYNQIERLMGPHIKAERHPNGNPIHQSIRVGTRRLTSYAFLTAKLMRQAEEEIKTSMLLQIDIDQVRWIRKRQSQAGKRRGDRDRERNEKIISTAEAMKTTGDDDRRINAKLALRFGLTPTRIGQIRRRAANRKTDE